MFVAIGMDVLLCHKVDQLIHQIFRHRDPTANIDDKGVHDFEEEGLIDAVLHVLDDPGHSALEDRLVINLDQLCIKVRYVSNMIWIEL